jgi:hypothetical protein
MFRFVGFKKVLFKILYSVGDVDVLFFTWWLARGFGGAFGFGA